MKAGGMAALLTHYAPDPLRLPTTKRPPHRYASAQSEYYVCVYI